MPSLKKRSKPKTVTDRVKTAGAAAGDLGKAVGNAAKAAGEVVGEGAKTVRDRAAGTTKSTPSALDSTKAKAAAAAGLAAGAAGAVAYRLKSQSDEPEIKFDPKAGEPTSVTTTETPEAKAAKEVTP
jgi:hypothetical protein